MTEEKPQIFRLTKDLPRHKMPQGIINNCLGHYSQGRDEGYNSGYNDGLTVGFDNGEKAQYDEFWDSFQNNGKRTVYDYCFWRWNNTTFKPKYSIMPQGTANSIFREISGIDDLDKWFKDLKITVDLSKATSLNDGFYGFKGM